jgi:hypothetical protein
LKYRVSAPLLAALALLVLPPAAAAQSPVQARLEGVIGSRFLLAIGTETLEVETGFTTRYWRNRRQAQREQFRLGDRVFVRVKADTTPAQLREIACEASWQWLERIRRETLPATLLKADGKALEVRFDDGSEFAYRTTASTEFRLRGAKAGLTDLKQGDRIYVKGRGLASLDILAATVSDQPPPPPAVRSGAKAPAPKPVKLAPAGKLKGIVVSHVREFRMVDLRVEGQTLHITYDGQTKWTLNGFASRPEEVRPDMKATVTYKRDAFGRIIAQKVELF